MMTFSACHDVNKFGEHCYEVSLVRGPGFHILKEMSNLPYTWLSGSQHHRRLTSENNDVEKYLLKNLQLQLVSKSEVLEDPAVNGQRLMQKMNSGYWGGYELFSSDLSSCDNFYFKLTATLASLSIIECL